MGVPFKGLCRLIARRVYRVFQKLKEGSSLGAPHNVDNHILEYMPDFVERVSMSRRDPVKVEQ